MSSYKALRHFGFAVSDLARSVKFYRTLLGYGPAFEHVGEGPYLSEMLGSPRCKMAVALFDLPGSDATLELLQYLNPAMEGAGSRFNEVGNGHFSLLVTDLDAEVARLRRLGITSLGPDTVRITVGRNEGATVAYFVDPDGLGLELLEAARPAVPNAADQP